MHALQRTISSDLRHASWMDGMHWGVQKSKETNLCGAVSIYIPSPKVKKVAAGDRKHVAKPFCDLLCQFLCT